MATYMQGAELSPTEAERAAVKAHIEQVRRTRKLSDTIGVVLIVLTAIGFVAAALLSH